METKDGLSAAVLEVLDKDNYVAWSVRVKTYLMVQDLWEVVEATTEPPKQEDDEATLKAWSNKNSMALHVLQVSCGPHALSMITQISSAKIAWNTLAVVLQVLKKDNYVAWSVRVKTYLMVHDLWDIIEGTTEPPRQEDDEAAFKAWSKKNSRALHVIQISCGQDTFFEIIEISSAKVAWDTLAKKFLQVLKKDNYVAWSVRVKTYLMAHDLWDIIEGTTKPPKQEDDEAAFKAWSKKNSRALHVIQISCGRDTFSEIIEISSAKVAWDTLAKKFLQVLKKDNYVIWSVRVKTYLMAHDLWDIIEGTTKPPRQEDDEDAFKAWSKKNSMALHVIQISCGRDTFSEIIEISSAKVAWDTLAKKFLLVLEKDNYVDWSVRVKTYLMAHGLWEIIEATTEPPRQEDDEDAFKAWSKKNSMALHVIQISCGQDTFSKIIQISSAKIAWDTLYNMPTNTNSGSGENGNVDYVQYEALKGAVQSGDWSATEDFLKHHPGAAGAKVTILGQTALTIAVQAGHEDIVEKLVDVMSEEDLAIPDRFGNIALVSAINAGNYRMIACMVRKNNNLLRIKSSAKRLPVNQAIASGDIELARYLYSFTPLEYLTPEKGKEGAILCSEAIYNRSLDIALHLIEHCPHLALALDEDNCSPLYALASMLYAFPSGDQPLFWKRWIYSCIHIQPASAIKEIRLNIQNVEKCQNHKVKIIGSGIKDLYETKLVHGQSHELLDRMCKEVSISRSISVMDKAVIRSIEKGNFEFIFAVVRANPNSLWVRCEDEMSMFAFAVLHRQEKIFSLIFRLSVKATMTTWVDGKGNCILHMAGMTSPSILLNRIHCAALQMQRELQWFKEVESIVPPRFKEFSNKDGLTPRALFTKNHKDLKKEGEKWMKDTATSCTVVGALIVTIMFAAVFTVPGGNKQDTGFPVFLEEKLFMLFIISDALSLFSSSTSILMFLGILISRYAEEDFLESLPRKMIIGLSTLLFSIVAMMMAFSAALLITLHGQLWIVIPVICLASVPVTLFGLMQFPLLVDMFISTYRLGIFDKKMERWL